MCIDTDKERISTLSITPRWLTRFVSLFRGATYRVVIAHRGRIDKLAIFLNDEEVGSVTPDYDKA